MVKWKKAFALTMLSSLPIAGYAACDATWNGLTSSWNDVANWNPAVCVPGLGAGALDMATFGTSGVLSVSLDATPIQPNLRALDLNNSGASYTISGNSSNYIQFNDPNSALNVSAGNHNINAPIKLNNVTLAITINPSSGLTFQGELIDLGTSSVNLTGAGQLVNNMGQIVPIGNFSASGGSLSNLNSASVAGAAGSLISASNFTLTNETVLNNNVATINAGKIGVQLQASATFTINGGSLTNSNSGKTIGSTTKGSVVSAADLNINSGQFNNINNGEVTGSNDVGALVQVANNLIINGGILTNTNTAAITGSHDIGSKIDVGNQFIITGGAFVANTNSGSTTGSTSRGSVIRAGNRIDISNGSFTNNDHVQANSVVIGGAGVLSGTGIYQDSSGGETTQVINGGRMVLGDASFSGSAGTVNVQGSYQQSPSGTLVAHLGSPTSLLNVTGTPGTATLAGTLEADFITGSINLSNHFTVMHAENGVSGTFSSVTTPGNPNVLGHAQYTGDSVILFFTPTIPSGNGASGAAGSSVFGIFPAIVTPTVVFASSSNFMTFTSQRMYELSRRTYPDEYEEGNFATRSIPRQGMAELSSGFFAANDFGGGNSWGFARKADPLIAADETIQQQEQLKRRLLDEKSEHNYPAKFYIGPQGSIGKAGSVHYWQAGATAGFDYSFKEAGVGIGVISSYTHSRGKGFNIDEVSTNLYGTYKPKREPHLTMNWILGGAWDWYDYRSKTGFASDPKTAKGSTSGPQFKSLLGLQYTFKHDQFCSIPEKLEISPIISAMYQRAYAKKYHQHGADQFNMAFGGLGVKSFRTILGTHVFYKWVWENFEVAPDFYVAWEREFLLKNTTMRSRPIAFSGPPTTIVVPGIGRNIVKAAFDLLLTFYHVYDVEANYCYEWNKKFYSHNLFINFNYHF